MISSYLSCQSTLSELVLRLTSLNDLSSLSADYSSCVSSQLMVQVRRVFAKRESVQEEYTYAEGVQREISTGKRQGVDEGKGPGSVERI